MGLPSNPPVVTGIRCKTATQYGSAEAVTQARFVDADVVTGNEGGEKRVQMKGMIFHAVERAVVNLMGAPAWEELILAANARGVYDAERTYPDEELMALVAAAAEATGHTPEDVQRLVGYQAIVHLIENAGRPIDPKMHVFDFLESVHRIIHTEVKRQDPAARPPDIIPYRVSPTELQLFYRSERGLSPLAEGLIVGAGEYFGQPVKVAELKNAGRIDDTAIQVRLVAEAELPGAA